MKTQIIQLTSHDDLISVRDKMSWSQTGRILLVWPKHAHILDRQLDLNLIKRHAHAMGAQLALVTQDADVRFYARQAGIPVYDNSYKAQNSHWRTSRRRKIDFVNERAHLTPGELRELIRPTSPTWLKHPAVRPIFFGISVLSLFVLGIVILPGARVTITPEEITQSMTFSVSADPSLASINITTGSLPAYIQEVTVEGRDTITTTGKTVIPDQPAVGELLFTNNADHKISVPVGTIVATAGKTPIRFMTSSSNEVSIGPGKSATLVAHALQPGKSGNLPIGSLVTIEGEVGPDLTVTNPSATRGGTEATVQSPSQADLNLLHERLTNTLKQTALHEMQLEIPTGDTLVESSFKITDTISESSSPNVGDPGTQLELTLRLRLQSQVVSAQNLEKLVLPVLDTNLPKGYTPLRNSLTIRQISLPSLGEQDNSRWTIRAERSLRAIIPTGIALGKIKGMMTNHAIEYLQASLPHLDEVKISPSPSWWPWMPLLPVRMQVTEVGAP